jgi:hypothetical protein
VDRRQFIASTGLAAAGAAADAVSAGDLERLPKPGCDECNKLGLWLSRPCGDNPLLSRE